MLSYNFMTDILYIIRVDHCEGSIFHQQTRQLITRQHDIPLSNILLYGPKEKIGLCLVLKNVFLILCFGVKKLFSSSMTDKLERWQSVTLATAKHSNLFVRDQCYKSFYSFNLELFAINWSVCLR